MTDLEKLRESIFNGKDRDLIFHVGYFITWYNQVEWKLTLLMAIVMNERDFESFHELTRGMDGKTKVQRFKAICEVKKWTISESFDRQLDYYGNKLGKFRDKLSHRALINDEEKEDRFHFATLDKMPWKQLGVTNAPTQPTEHILKTDFFQKGLWLNSFADDLNEIIDAAIQRTPLGLANPRAKVPNGRPDNPQDS